MLSLGLRLEEVANARRQTAADLRLLLFLLFLLSLPILLFLLRLRVQPLYHSLRIQLRPPLLLILSHLN